MNRAVILVLLGAVVLLWPPSLAGAAEELGSRADFKGIHLFNETAPIWGGRAPGIAHVRSIPQSQLLGIGRDAGQLVIHWHDGTQAQTARPTMYLRQHGAGNQPIDESLQLGRMAPWGAPQIAAARFQAIRSIARQGFLPVEYARHALGHYARQIGDPSLQVSYGASARDFGKTTRTAPACPTCGHAPARTPRGRR